MEHKNSREYIIASLIANTRRKLRRDNLVEIARQIRWLERDLGSLRKVSETIGISVDQITQFLSVEKLCPEVRKLVEDRKIDLINTVHYIRNFNPSEQQVIARRFVAGDLSAGDIRVLAPLRTKMPNSHVGELISMVKESKDINVYVAYFRTMESSKDIDKLRERFEKIIGRESIIDLKFQDGGVGCLELTQNGNKRLKKAAKMNGQSLRELVESVVLGGNE